MVNVLCRYLQTPHARGKSKESRSPQLLLGRLRGIFFATGTCISTLGDSWDCWDEFGVYTF